MSYSNPGGTGVQYRPNDPSPNIKLVKSNISIIAESKWKFSQGKRIQKQEMGKVAATKAKYTGNTYHTYQAKKTRGAPTSLKELLENDQMTGDTGGDQNIYKAV